MIHIKDTCMTNTSAALSEALRIASQFGFRMMDDIPRVADKNQKNITTEEAGRIASSIQFARKEEKALGTVARKYLASEKPSHGVLLVSRINKSSTAPNTVTLELHVMGATEVFAESMLLVVARAILRSCNMHEYSLSLNNIGTHESSGRFMRDVGVFLRKHAESITPALRIKIDQDPLGTLVQLVEKGHPAIARAPQPMEYLNEDERKNLWQFLEYIESTGMEYDVNSRILGSRDCWAQSLYEIQAFASELGAQEVVAFGGRYDALMSRYAKRKTGAAMISLPFELVGTSTVAAVPQHEPRIFFGYIGTEAKKKALTVLDTLYTSSIPIAHQLWHGTLGEQMHHAQSMHAPFLLLMGHKEAVENNIIVRDVLENSQDTVPFSELVGYLKRRKIASVA